MAFEAACLLRILGRGSDYEKACCEPLIRKLRKTRWACANDPRGKLSDCNFLERFIEAHAPGWDWQKDAALGEIEDRNHKRDNEQIAKGLAEHLRLHRASRSKFVTPDVPDAVLLSRLDGWRTLRELKLATAMSERQIKKIIHRLGPKKAEIVDEPRRKFSRRGKMPKVYAPRLVSGVLNEFLKRLPHYPIIDEERERCRKAAMATMHVLAANPPGQ
jgi:hypothetical protein